MQVANMSHTPTYIKTKPLLTNKSVNFNGHLGNEKLIINGTKKIVRHETGFFRDMQTKNFVVNYITQNFGNSEKIKMLVGACSTGEEAYTYSMLLKPLQQRLSIIGFDISKKNIANAKSGEFVMQKIKKCPEKVREFFTSIQGDYFLSFKTNEIISPEQQKHKALFDELFDISPETFPEKLPLLKRINNWYVQKILKIQTPEFENKIVRLKKDVKTNCQFQQGDILKLEEVTQGEKAHIITFSNAMYHLTTDDFIYGQFRLPKKNSEEIIRTIGQKVKENLHPKGIFVLGEDEIGQMMDGHTLPKVFEELGFIPLNKTKEHDVNVWQLP